MVYCLCLDIQRSLYDCQSERVPLATLKVYHRDTIKGNQSPKKAWAGYFTLLARHWHLRTHIVYSKKRVFLNTRRNVNVRKSKEGILKESGLQMSSSQIGQSTTYVASNSAKLHQWYNFAILSYG